MGRCLAMQKINIFAMLNYTIIECEQNTPEWFAFRSGVVTGSNIGNLITTGLKLSESAAAKRYISGLIWERNNGQSLDLMFDKYQSYSMIKGKESEPEALRTFDVFGEFQTCGFVLHKSGIFGVSPDAVKIQNGVIVEGVEIKTPDSKNTFLDLNGCKNGNDLRAVKFDWWLQCQLSMYVTDLLSWWFVSYVPDYTNVFQVERNEQTMEVFKQIQI